MTDSTKSTFARRIRAAKPRTRKYDVWDDAISGLGLRVGTSGHRSFFLRRTVRGRIRSTTIGNADTMTLPQARREARELIAAFLDTMKNDGGPRTPGRPMDAFAEEFLERYARHWKPVTLENSAYVVRKYILPAFGHLTVNAITVEHVKDWFASMAERRGNADRSMPVLSVMMRMAELWGYRPHNSNPCKNTRRYPMKPKERFLTPEEMARLNDAVPLGAEVVDGSPRDGREREPRRRHQAREGDPGLPGIRGRVSPALRTALEALGTRDRAHLPQGPHPARLRKDAARPHRPGGRGRVVRRGEQGQAGRGQPRLRDSARDDVPGRGMGPARARQQPLPRYREEPEKPCRPVPRRGRTDPARARSTPAKPNCPKPSPRSGCWRSPDAGAARC